MWQDGSVPTLTCASLPWDALASPGPFLSAVQWAADSEPVPTSTGGESSRRVLGPWEDWGRCPGFGRCRGSGNLKGCPPSFLGPSLACLGAL